MADRRQSKKATSKRAGGAPEDNKQDHSVPLGKVLRTAVQQFSALVGHRVEGVTSVSKQDDGWRITIEVLELERVPNTTDVLASYDVQLDGDGEITGYARVQRYTRAQTEEG